MDWQIILSGIYIYSLQNWSNSWEITYWNHRHILYLTSFNPLRRTGRERQSAVDVIDGFLELPVRITEGF